MGVCVVNTLPRTVYYSHMLLLVVHLRNNLSKAGILDEAKRPNSGWTTRKASLLFLGAWLLATASFAHALQLEFGIVGQFCIFLGRVVTILDV